MNSPKAFTVYTVHVHKSVAKEFSIKKHENVVKIKKKDNNKNVKIM